MYTDIASRGNLAERLGAWHPSDEASTRRTEELPSTAFNDLPRSAEEASKHFNAVVALRAGGHRQRRRPGKRRNSGSRRLTVAAK